MPLKIALYLVAVSQFALGALTLFAPAFFLTTMGLTPPAPDNGYILAMLGARFVAYGIGMVWLARQSEPDRFWVRNMVLIQLIDFGAGAVYLGLGTVGLSVVAFPMFNAALFAGLLLFFSRPRAFRS